MFMSLIEKRRSIRRFTGRQVESEKIDILLEAALRSPSSRGFNPWRFVVVTDKAIKSKVAGTTNRPEVFEKASAIIAACSNSDYVMRCGQAIGPIDVAIALEHISLQAADLGLGTCWIGSFDAEKVRRILAIPEDVAIIELMTVGYPTDTKPEPKREPIEKIVCYETWKF